MAVGLKTYMDTFSREDLLDLIKDIDPNGTPLSDLMRGKTTKPEKPENELWKKLQQLL